jgi:hypothetical protein
MNGIGCSFMFLSLIQADYHFNFQHVLNIVFEQKQLASTDNNPPTVKFAISDVELILGFTYSCFAQTDAHTLGTSCKRHLEFFCACFS